MAPVVTAEELAEHERYAMAGIGAGSAVTIRLTSRIRELEAERDVMEPDPKTTKHATKEPTR